MNNLGMDGGKFSRSPEKRFHSEVMQVVTQLVLPVEPAWLRWGTGVSGGCSHYEEDDLIGSKMKNSSREEQVERGKEKVPSVR